MPYLFSLSRYQTKCIIKFLFRLKLYNNGWQGEKEEKMEKQKFKYLENEKSFLDEIKTIFHSFWRAIIWW